MNQLLLEANCDFLYRKNLEKMSLKNKIWNCYSLISKKIKNEFKKIKYEIVTA